MEAVLRRYAQEAMCSTQQGASKLVEKVNIMAGKSKPTMRQKLLPSEMPWSSAGIIKADGKAAQGWLFMGIVN